MGVLCECERLQEYADEVGKQLDKSEFRESNK
jgi:hypothetical protein